jgi:hypothetical protein
VSDLVGKIHCAVSRRLKMKTKVFLFLIFVLLVFCTVHAWIDPPAPPPEGFSWNHPAARIPGTQPIWNNPDARVPGTQPILGRVTLTGPDNCLNCHGGYDEAVEPGFNWIGSMMAQAARDPVFWACYTVSMQDAIWAIPNDPDPWATTPDVGDLCQRCHFPDGWLTGESDPPNASLMTGADYDGVHCDFCHRMWDPFFETTFDGTRESDDWEGYWGEAGNTGPGSGTDSQNGAVKTYDIDLARTTTNALRIPIIKFLSGDLFYNSSHLPVYSTYTEAGGGQYFVSDDGAKRGGWADVDGNHSILYSRFHKSKYFCGACHDVSNPALANLELAGLPDQSGGEHLISEQYPAYRYFHIERTFSEFMLSAYAQTPGAATNPEYEALSGGIDWAGKCQDCHMPEVTGYASNKPDSPLRPDDSTEHPNDGMPIHDFSGGNPWTLEILASLDSSGPIYDPCNVAILDKGPAVLTLDLDAGLSPKDYGAAIKAGSDRAKNSLQIAATLKDLAYGSYEGLSFKVQNNTGHKLISGFPEGRRMFLNIKAYSDEGSLIGEVNPYDYTVGTLKGLEHSASSPALDPNESYMDELVYEVHFESALTGEAETFHAALATGRAKDNRIPPKGFDIANAAERLCEPTYHGHSESNYFTAEEYAGGYDQVSVPVPFDANHVSATLYYQGTSREYIEFLRDEINGDANSLTSPTLSGEPNAYIIQTDPFFSQLKEWGNTIWDLWYHNHGLDGSGASVEGIVPLAMATASLGQIEFVPLLCDFEPNGRVDEDDLMVLITQWLHEGEGLSADIVGDDDIVNLRDFAALVEHWRKGCQL